MNALAPKITAAAREPLRTFLFEQSLGGVTPITRTEVQGTAPNESFVEPLTKGSMKDPLQVSHMYWSPKIDCVIVQLAPVQAPTLQKN